MDRQFREFGNWEKKRPTPMTYIALLVCIFAVIGLVCFNQKAGPFSEETLTHPKVQDDRTEAQAREDFDKLATEIFKEEISDDTITLNFRIKDREKYGLQATKPT